MSSIKIRAKQAEGLTQIRVLITHPMHNGRIKDPVTGVAVPAHFIEHLRVEHNGRLIADCRLSTAVARDPYLGFRFRGGEPGDRITVRWTDNLGQSDQLETAIR